MRGWMQGVGWEFLPLWWCDWFDLSGNRRFYPFVLKPALRRRPWPADTRVEPGHRPRSASTSFTREREDVDGQFSANLPAIPSFAHAFAFGVGDGRGLSGTGVGGNRAFVHSFSIFFTEKAGGPRGATETRFVTSSGTD